MSKAYPKFTTKPTRSGNCHCPLGFAPSSNAEPECMYCGHVVRATCHVDFGVSEAGWRIVDRSPLKPGERLPIRYARQTSLYVGGYWLDLPEVRKRLEEVIRAYQRADDADALHAAGERMFEVAEQVARLLPSRAGSDEDYACLICGEPTDGAPDDEALHLDPELERDHNAHWQE